MLLLVSFYSLNSWQMHWPTMTDNTDQSLTAYGFIMETDAVWTLSMKRKWLSCLFHLALFNHPNKLTADCTPGVPSVEPSCEVSRSAVTSEIDQLTFKTQNKKSQRSDQRIQCSFYGLVARELLPDVIRGAKKQHGGDSRRSFTSDLFQKVLLQSNNTQRLKLQLN